MSPITASNSSSESCVRKVRKTRKYSGNISMKEIETTKRSKETCLIRAKINCVGTLKIASLADLFLLAVSTLSMVVSWNENKLEELDSYRQSLCRVLSLRGDITETQISRAVGECSIEMLNRGRHSVEDAHLSAVVQTEQEEVRERLRQANSVDDLKRWISRARELDMEFEASLGDRKLAKLQQEHAECSELVD